MKNQLISIIVPVYKVEEYLDKCIKSILNQTYTNLEIILVDDGSPDNCGKICDEYAKNDKRIIVIHKENGGLSDARNKGIEIAKGEYIAFIDSDDYIEKDMFEILYNLSVESHSDISMVSYKEIQNEVIINENKEFTENIFEYSNTEAIKELLKDDKIKNYAWNKLYKKELFKEIRYPVKMAYEDVGTTYKLFEKANKIIWKDTPKYNYIRRDDSIVSKNTYKNLKDFIDLSYERYLHFEKNREIRRENNFSFIKSMIMFYLNYMLDDIDELDEIFENLYPELEEIMNEYHDEMIIEISKQNLVATVYYLIEWDRKKSKEILKLIMEKRKNKKEIENKI